MGQIFITTIVVKDVFLTLHVPVKWQYWIDYCVVEFAYSLLSAASKRVVFAERNVTRFHSLNLIAFCNLFCSLTGIRNWTYYVNIKFPICKPLHYFVIFLFVWSYVCFFSLLIFVPTVLAVSSIFLIFLQIIKTNTHNK